MKKKKRRAKKKRKQEKRLRKMEEARKALLKQQEAAVVMVEGYAGTMASATTMLTQAHSLGVMFGNAVNQQNNGFISQNAQTAQGVIQLFKKDLVEREMKFIAAEELEE